MTAIVTCGDSRQSLSVVRSLGRAEIPVAVGAKIRPALSMWSRFATSTFLTENPDTRSYAFAEQIANEIRARYAICALASTDTALWALSRFRELMPIAARRLLPPHYSVVRSLDHEALHHFAQSLGIPCAPLIRVDSDLSHNQALASLDGLCYPMLIRPIVPWSQMADVTIDINRRLVARSKDHLEKMLRELPDMNNGFLASAYQSLRAISYFGVAQKGEVLVEGFQERLNELEPYNEVATLAKSISPIVSIRNHSRELLSALQWQGPFKVEYIKDKNGNYKLMSLIGRMWGSLALAITAGVNIPLICYRLAEGTLTSEILRNARPNVSMRWLLGDVQAKLLNPAKMAIGLMDWLQELRMRTLWDSVLGKRDRITSYDVFDMHDPMPFLYEMQSKTWRKIVKERETKRRADNLPGTSR